MNHDPTRSSEYKRHDTAAERLPEAVLRKLERNLRRRVVVVDDDRIALRLIHKLVPKGWTVQAFEDPMEALAVLVVDDPVAVISDLRMPAFDGIGFLREVAHARPAVRRILMSGFRDKSDFARAINEAGIYRFISKPVSRDAIHEVLEGAFAQRRRELAVELLVEDVKSQNRELEAARRALQEREAHLLHQERLAVLGRLTDGLALGVNPTLERIRSVAEELGALATDPEDQELLGMGRDSVEAVRDILSDIGRFTRDGALDLEPGPTDLAELCRRTVRFATFDRRFRSREVVTRIDPVPEARVDARRIRQLLLNLLRNAADATSEGDAIEVRLHAQAGEAVLSVRDTGTGMAAHVAEHVYDEFFSTKGQGGLGLGLSLCRKIAHQHGGTISCTSKLGEGTCFFVRLPLSPRPGAG